MRVILTLAILVAVAACNTTSSEGEKAAPVAQVAQAPQPQIPPQPLEPGKPPKPAAVAALKATAAKSFKDPDSAKWDRMQQAMRPNTKGEPTDVVCGYVNAKNSYGGYTGAKPFVFFVERNDLMVSGEGGDVQRVVMPDILKRFCVGLI